MPSNQLDKRDNNKDPNKLNEPNEHNVLNDQNHLNEPNHPNELQWSRHAN